jgi:penicillin-binding protein-related factor A (putative recombinase)
MPTLGRVRAGHKARSIGQTFEKMIELSAARDNITAVRIPDSCKPTRRGASMGLVRIRSPFDYVLLSSGYGITLDAKTTAGSTFAFSDICQHQLHSLSRCADQAFLSGYLIWYRTPDMVAFHSSSRLRRLERSQSLRPENGLLIGTSSRMYLSKLFAPALTHPGILPTE